MTVLWAMATKSNQGGPAQLKRSQHGGVWWAGAPQDSVDVGQKMEPTMLHGLDWVSELERITN